MKNKKFKVGDKVKAITNNYGITTIDNQWEGVITDISGDGHIDTITTNSINEGYLGTEFIDLNPDDFELVAAGNISIQIRGYEDACEVANTLIRNGYWARVAADSDDYNCECSVYFKESEE